MRKLPIWITGIALGVGAVALPPTVAFAQDADTPGTRVDKDDVPEVVRRTLRDQVKNPTEIRYFKATSGTETVYAAQYRKGEEGKRRQIVFAADGTVLQAESDPGPITGIASGATGSRPRDLRGGTSTGTAREQSLRQRLEAARQAIEAEQVEADRERTRAAQAIDRRVGASRLSDSERRAVQRELDEIERQAVVREQQATDRAREAQRDLDVVNQQIASGTGVSQSEQNLMADLRRYTDDRRRLALETARLAVETRRGTERTALALRPDDVNDTRTDEYDLDDRIDSRTDTRLDDRGTRTDDRPVRASDRNAKRTRIKSGDLPRRVHDAVTRHAESASDMVFYRIERSDGTAYYNVFFTRNPERRRVGLRVNEDGKVLAGPTEIESGGGARQAGDRSGDRIEDRDRLDGRGTGSDRGTSSDRGTGGTSDGGRLIRREEITRADLPRDARSALDQRLSEAKDVTVYRQERDGGTFYSAHYTDRNNRRMEIRVNERGSVVSGPHETRSQPDDRDRR